jgi:ketosteroid isomerase-like protein
MTTPLQNLSDFYEHLSPASLPQIRKLYAADAQFKDPFNDVQGIAAIEAIFEHMFATTQNPQFKVLQTLQEGNHALLVWDFRFEKQGFSKPVCIHGTSLIAFNAEGLALRHRDYWDSGEELFAKLPWVGGLFRWFARQFKSPQSSIHPA